MEHQLIQRYDVAEGNWTIKIINNPYNIIKGKVMFYEDSDEGSVTTEIETTPDFLECNKRLNETKLRRTLLEAEESPGKREFEAENTAHEMVGLSQEITDSHTKLHIDEDSRMSRNREEALTRIRLLFQMTHADAKTSSAHT